MRFCTGRESTATLAVAFQWRTKHLYSVCLGSGAPRQIIDLLAARFSSQLAEYAKKRQMLMSM